LTWELRRVARRITAVSSFLTLPERWPDRRHELSREGAQQRLECVAGRRHLAEPDGVVGWIEDPLYRHRANHDSPEHAMNFSNLLKRLICLTDVLEFCHEAVDVNTQVRNRILTPM